MDTVTISKGSHSSPQDGQCIMEYVSMIARDTFSDHPECVCPVLRTYAIRINDAMPTDVMRSELLLPLTNVLLNTKSDCAKEIERGKFLAMWTVSRILPPMLRKIGLSDNAVECEDATTLTAANAAARAAAAGAAARDAVAYAARAAADAADAARAANAAANAAARAANAAAGAAARAANAAAGAAARAAARAARAAAYASDAYRAVFAVAVEGLKQAALL